MTKSPVMRAALLWILGSACLALGAFGFIMSVCCWFVHADNFITSFATAGFVLIPTGAHCWRHA